MTFQTGGHFHLRGDPELFCANQGDWFSIKRPHMNQSISVDRRQVDYREVRPISLFDVILVQPDIQR